MNSTMYCAKIITLIFTLCLLFSVAAQARFDYSQVNNGEWVATTTTNNKDGLGQILREIGVQPNWSNRSWINEIRNYNPNIMDSKGKILRYGEKLNIPINALRNCNGYSALVIKLSGINKSKTNISNQPIELKTEETKAVPAPVRSQQVKPNVTDNYDGMKQVTDNQVKFFHLWGGLGMSQASNSDSSSNTKTSLYTDLSYHFGTSFKFSLLRNIDTELFAQADYRKYKDPDNLSVSQNKKLYLNYGFNLSYWLSSEYRLGLFVESANTPRTHLLTNSIINVSNDSFIKIGPSLLIPFSISKASDLTVDLRPSFILSKDVDNIEYDSGFGLKTMINFYFGSPLFMGLDFNYENQNTDSADNSIFDGYLKIGYAI